MNAEIIYFSATGTTRKIIKEFAKGLDCEMHFTDITLPDNRESYKPLKCDLLVIATPIYGERIPQFICEFIKQIDGNGSSLAVISVYGNMGYGISLAQFEDFSRNNHFYLIGAGTFIGEHTHANKNVPVAYGRPDEKDLQEAHDFGSQIREKWDARDFKPITLPKPTLPKFVTNFPDGGTRFLIRQPAVNPLLCNNCGVCAKRCPVGAIEPDTLNINEQKCIRCYACVKGCPKSARTAKFRVHLFKNIFRHLGGKQKENQIFL